MADHSLTLTTHEANLLATALDERRSGARIRIMIDQDGVKVDSVWGWTPGYGRPADEIKTKSDCPIGTVVTLGHPANKQLIVKGGAGWRYVETGALVDYDDIHKSHWNVYALPVGP